MITITYEKLMAALALFTALCVATGWLIKIIKALKKPGDDVKDRLKKHDELFDNDNKRIGKLEEDIEDIKSAQTQTLKALRVILDELARNNDTEGKIDKAKTEMDEFLINR